ncbi:Pyruvate,phosphate dikinase [Labilithrix luteola]|uniref:Pyruvate,phosphate dikinase n=1 Tax=Labilithrix luteola TaxID=1391654 RepID=A0A0K1PS97_9BACT|nr:PEP-utilizing enzyme [Labilithrix luteola]AKU96408.1 Pyruvate,phosphate dikinase [Labilithrix luteola]
MEGKQLLARGMGASPGQATGAIVFRSEDAIALAATGKPVILVRIETTSEDVPGMQVAAGIITTRGGLTGDGAIVARSLGKPCIAWCGPIRVDYASDSLTIWRDSTAEQADVVLKKGDVITIDGGRGEIWGV